MNRLQLLFLLFAPLDDWFVDCLDCIPRIKPIPHKAIITSNPTTRRSWDHKMFAKTRGNE